MVKCLRNSEVKSVVYFLDQEWQFLNCVPQKPKGTTLDLNKIDVFNTDLADV